MARNEVSNKNDLAFPFHLEGNFGIGLSKREYAAIHMLSARCGAFDFIPDRQTVADIIGLVDVLFEELEINGKL